MPVQYNYGALEQLGQGGIGELLQQAEARQQQGVVQNQQLLTAKAQRDKLAEDARQEKAQRQVNLLASLQKVEPGKRAQLYKAVLPTLQQLDPTAVLPAEWDDGLGAFAQAQAIGPKGLAELEMKEQSAEALNAYRTSTLDLKEQMLDLKESAGPKAPSGYTFTPDGTLAPIPGGPGDPGTKPLNEYQGKSALFASRMEQAEPVIEQFKDTNTLFNKNAAAIPVVGNMLAGADFQQLDQAKRNFINAVLRQESGAAIGQSEFDNAEKQYFAQPGDGPDVIEQKRQNRVLATAQMAKAAGPGHVPPARPKPAAPSGAGWKIERVD